ncbi:MAG TPA: glycosyltransferase [Candidatus Acidoferrales bacterium]
MTFAVAIILAVACIPFIYYLLSLYSTARYFSVSWRENPPNTDFFPPISCLKPIKGLDEDAYENYASFCRQDYPQYEILFCVDPDDPAVPVLEKLQRDFPDRSIRLIFGSGRNAINDKVGRLVRLVDEAKYDLLVITDGDIRVTPEYLRTVAHPFRDPKVGGATTLYASTDEKKFIEELQTIGMISDFFAGILVAWQLDGVKFMFGQTIVMTRKANAAFGTYRVNENKPADDLLAGRMVAEQGYEVKLLPYVVKTVADFNSMRDLLYKRTRWMTVMRLMRPWGHFGLVFTWGLPWSLIAIAVQPTLSTVAIFLGIYAILRIAMALLIGVYGMKQKGIWRKIPLIPVWDAVAFGIWLASFTRSTIRWRGVNYTIRDGMLVLPSQVKTQNATGD